MVASTLRSIVNMMLILLAVMAFALLGQADGHPHRVIAGRDTSTLTLKYPILVPFQVPSLNATAGPCAGSHCATANPLPESLPCNAANGTTFVETPGGLNYTMICDIDFPGQDIYPFIHAASFDECLAQCETYNHVNSAGLVCAGFVFAPDRTRDADDCYLKSSLNSPMPATIHLVGATARPTLSNCESIEAPKAMPTARVAKPAAPSRLRVDEFKILGSSCNKPSKQYVSHIPATPQKLASSLLVPGINTNLTTDYPLANDTGVWTQERAPSDADLADMRVTPHLSRDGGKGGTINGTHVFVFCDTASFEIDPVANTSQMVGFVSSSVATDDGLNALEGQPLSLVDNLGEWQDDVGRMRGFAPMTTGEETFNIELSGRGYRYAVWPESSLIPLNASHSLLFPAIVYDVVDMNTQSAGFHDLGNSVLLVSIDPTYGPVAERIVKQHFQQGQVMFGTLGGIRAWGPSGMGGNDGMLYLFGRTDSGVLLGRTPPDKVTDLSVYTYWNGQQWDGQLPASDSANFMIDFPVQDLDVVYFPAMHSFFMLYLNTFADNTIYYRYLPLDVYADGSGPTTDNIVNGTWSEEHVLAAIDAPPQGYIYAGGLHAGYFGQDDITNGGWKMLVTWTEHTGKDAASYESGYAHKSAYVHFAAQ